MDLDDEICLCFHVTKRKVINFIRLEQPRRVGQLSDCFGAGTGCGWCRKYLEQLYEASREIDAAETSCLPSVSEYSLARRAYIRAGKGTPPEGADPSDD